MITYDALTRYAPPASNKDERDQWFLDHGYEVDDLLRVASEVAEHRIRKLSEGDRISASELIATLVTAMLFGFELAVRVERDEPLDMSALNNGSKP